MEEAFLKTKWCSLPSRCAPHQKDFFLLGGSSSVWDCRLIRRPAEVLAENAYLALPALQEREFGHQKMALGSRLPPHNDGAARRVSLISVLQQLDRSKHCQESSQNGGKTAAAMLLISQSARALANDS
jgi:hypothetical protein